jgi:hypothetical protein
MCRLGAAQPLTTYQLRVELGQARLACIVEDEHGIDHGERWRGARWDGYTLQLGTAGVSRRAAE